MRVLVTGAAGFVGRALVAEILRQGHAGEIALEQLMLSDVSLEGFPADPCLVRCEGRFAGESALVAITAFAPDLVFHLAAMPGGAAEAHYATGRAVNLVDTMALFDALAERPKAVRVINASSLGVFGVPLPERIADDTPAVPTLSYGAHKLMSEIYLADLSRRGVIDGVSLRLPGIVARPPQPSGHISAFMSTIFHSLSRGEAFVCPTSPQASVLVMSVKQLIRNLLHAGELAADVLPLRRAFLLPCLRLTMSEIAQAIQEQAGHAGKALVSWRPDGNVEAQFGAYPLVTTAIADALGFRHDGNAIELVKNVL